MSDVAPKPPPSTDADEIADALTCLCVEKGGTCDLEHCQCENQDVANPGW